jgi:putative membrane protein
MTLLRLALGFICGVVATGPMSVAMVLLHRRLPARERYPLPPREITVKAVTTVMDRGDVTAATTSALTWLAHFAYGGAAGALYAGTERHLPGAAPVRGPLFGLLLWTVSYLGLLPGLHILTPATEHPLRRSALMIAAHLVWGWCIATVFQVLFSDLWRESTAFHASARPHRDTQSSS